MKKAFAPVLGSVILALSMAACSTATPSAGALSAVDQSGTVIAAPTVTLGAGDSSTLAANTTQALSELVQSAVAGSTGFDATGTVSISDVQSPSGIQVALNSASSGAVVDTLSFNVTAAAGTAVGSYPVMITLNDASGTATSGVELGTVTINVNVQ